MHGYNDNLFVALTMRRFFLRKVKYHKVFGFYFWLNYLVFKQTGQFIVSV